MEAKERVASALRSIGHPLPSMKITVNLSPANIRKNGTAFDFPIAVAFLGCLNLIDASKLEDICIMGELGLNGKIRGVGNCLPIVLEARKKGIHKFFAAREDANSLRGMEDIEVIFMDSLQDVLDYFHGTYQQRCCIDTTQYQKEETEEDFSDIIGQKHLKRAIEIAVTGRHHLLIIGSPGSGKTMAARRRENGSSGDLRCDRNPKIFRRQHSSISPATSNDPQGSVSWRRKDTDRRRDHISTSWDLISG